MHRCEGTYFSLDTVLFINQIKLHILKSPLFVFKWQNRKHPSIPLSTLGWSLPKESDKQIRPD